ncbi:T6SS phospholipase effector Tle1-like catalytic domain-containing protein [Halarcobacter sp.]|uniref:T6SS phospholipase effector Tle1-like catalytic domain-containing protein n=1 Tax=Halarcobacter sp. TaxID=2321133 RepID=UPI003AFF82F4
MNNTTHIFVAFDGTGNHKDNDLELKRGEESNVAQLFDLYNTPKKFKLYEKGVGTVELTKEQHDLIIAGEAKKSDYYESLDMAFGRGVKDKVESMLSQLKKALTEVPEGNRVVIDVVGFSRGATSARDFVNEVNKLYAQEIASGKLVLNNVILFDTVATVGLANDTNYGLNLNLNESSAKNILHLTSINEKRDNFSLESLKDKDGNTPKNVKEILLYGVHSDIGAGYKNSEEEYTVIKSGTYNPSKKEDLIQEAQNLGLQIKFHESQVRYKGDVYTYYKYSFVETETITNELSTVSLRLAYDELLNNGALLKEIPKQRQIPQELEEYYESIKNGDTNLDKYKDTLEKYIHNSSYRRDDYFKEPLDRFLDWLANRDTDDKREVYTNEEIEAVHSLVPSSYSNEDGIKEVFYCYIRTQLSSRIEGINYIKDSVVDAVEDVKEFIFDKFEIKDKTAFEKQAIEQKLEEERINSQGIEDLKELSLELTNRVEQNKEEKIENIEKEFEIIDSKITLEERLQCLQEYKIISCFDNNYARQLLEQYQDKVIKNQGKEVSSLDFINMEIKQEEKRYLNFEALSTNQNNNSQIQTMS